MKSSEDVGSLLQSLKLVLKSKGMTYKSLAKNIGLSEASVKRMFSRQEMSLSRLAEICDLLKIPLDELFMLGASKQKIDGHTYTDAQERALASDLGLLAFFDHLLQNYSIAQMNREYGLPMASIRKYLKKLESMRLVEVHPGDKIRFLVSNKVQWQKNGPLRRKLFPLAQREFLDSSFEAAGEERKFMSVRLSEQTLKRFQVQINDLTFEISKVASIEQRLGNEQITDVGFLFASRPWKFSALELTK